MVKKFQHQEKMSVPFNDGVIYDIVKDVLDYPAFLPWCLSARMVEKGDGFFVADLLVGISPIKETFRSQVQFDDNKKSITTSGQGDSPLRTMNSHWQFTKTTDQQTDIHFSVDFQFSSPITEKLFSPFFQKMIEKMSSAFLARAKTLTNK